MLIAVVGVHTGGVSPVGLLADLDLPDGAAGGKGLAQAGEDACGYSKL